MTSSAAVSHVQKFAIGIIDPRGAQTNPTKVRLLSLFYDTTPGK
jgi:hypothetical protein